MSNLEFENIRYASALDGSVEVDGIVCTTKSVDFDAKGCHKVHCSFAACVCGVKLVSVVSSLCQIFQSWCHRFPSAFSFERKKLQQILFLCFKECHLLSHFKNLPWSVGLFSLV